MQTIAKGKPQLYNDSGVFDSRVRIGEGRDDLQGHVIMTIGGRRIFVHSTELMSTTNEYQRALQY